MALYYWAQREEVLNGTADVMRAPVVAIHPSWKTNGVYHDLFWGPWNEIPESFWRDVMLIQELQWKHYDEQRANVVDLNIVY